VKTDFGDLFKENLMRCFFNYPFIKLFLFSTVFFLFTCSSSSDSDGNCEVVVNAQGPGFLRVVNNLNSKVEVFLTEYAFSAVLNADKCEIYGLDIGRREIEISRCIDSHCDSYSDSRTVYITIEDGETETIEVNSSFF
jgi:hypothetical protein